MPPLGMLAMPPRDGSAEVRRLVTEAENLTPEPPRPLMRELSPADPFPVDALGDVLGAAARGINDRVQAPVAIGAQSVLGAAALTVQGQANIELPIGGGSIKPVSCYFVTVAATGERKSECDRQALWPVEKREAALRASRDRDLPDYTNDKAAWDRAREVAIKAGKGSRAGIKSALDVANRPFYRNYPPGMLRLKDANIGSVALKKPRSSTVFKYGFS
jgi:Protein of unknown function (DUF3987)